MGTWRCFRDGREKTKEVDEERRLKYEKREIERERKRKKWRDWRDWRGWGVVL